MRVLGVILAGMILVALATNGDGRLDAPELGIPPAPHEQAPGRMGRCRRTAQPADRNEVRKPHHDQGQ